MPYKDKEKERQNKKEYYQKNKEKVLKRTKSYHKIWYQKNKRKRQQQIREWYQKNKEKSAQYHKKWYQKNKRRISQQSRKYHQQNIEKIRRRNRRYNQKNKEKILQYKGEWQKYQRKINPRYRLDENMGSAIARSLKEKKNGQPWEILAGYSLEKLIVHLEKQFDNKMNWHNYGSYWAVDHIKPKSLFNYTSSDDSDFKKCWDLRNLQPLEKIKNIKKNNLYIG
ncbi:MAG: hypothetical protein COX35_00975 [Candidatus Nealsonbacteria bacterium CG23_combo_of_CG06-09_8_20_14_all_37_18]|uniref:Uncharacterized protein n=1 Tax=Candidatus Nealsonbacteria bacterium CG23_combo_of_CG06-09_8_20_14_all_37_18 TaxID=1974720 RepID=A0A2G9YYR6_9BACT|nr:MAG: hypothetical protein COX35_00975 [Candidatus Nealsonbacteria bacterium CG23_combo_of_CG06-09_8_20_14_all_37_18]